jgi:hypothetical protein
VHTDVECPQEEDWPPEEIQKWEFGRRKLATLMGAEESFSEKEVEEALCYLMPTKLTARDTRPLMKVRAHCSSSPTHAPIHHCSTHPRSLIREKVKLFVLHTCSVYPGFRVCI